MKKLIKWNGKLMLRDWKTRLLLIGFFVFLGSFSLLYRQQNVTLPEVQLRSEYSDAHQIFRMIPDSHFEGEVGQEVQLRLGRNSTLIGLNRYILSQREGNTIDGWEEVVSDYLNNGREMAENNLFLHEATEFESYELLQSVYLPSVAETQQELAFYNALEDYGLDIEWNPYASSQILEQQLELFITTILFIVIALLAGDHFTKEQMKNYSVTQGIPIPIKRQWRIRSSLLWAMTWGVALIGLLCSYLISLVFETTGSLNYPSDIYINQTVSYIPLWQYALLLLGMGMIVSYLFLLIITGLSWMIRNVYLTLFVTAGLVMFYTIWQFFTPVTGWQPSFYTNIVGVVTGSSAAQYQLPGIEFWRLPLIGVGVWLMLEGVFHYIFSFIPTQTLGLKRRESK
ncbi:hypothetical protein [Alkalibacterium olivapovliticus]|uniref:ABC-2 family transporter n=1 Tax=Alkalibacterium olivapovliticus TaxID=99907 RepID=A0A2T0W8U3_9LACT|nr:hypothetical protein [Alkalibacterium olivapovliticus]PRY83137.1 hypothetical protein CLV38_10642 [Alkalibacterium olivapovliticus]